ncbi:PilZ domain-containing protein [Sphingomonadaceae bacterium]|nr:PilZ domain-containing protein [Sphingomonadaceae bacterium]
MQNRRQTDRQRITVQGRYRSGYNQYKNVTILGLSEAGCSLFDTSAKIRQGETLTLRIDTLGPFEATVIWINAAQFGVQFAKPLYGPVFDHICKNLDTPEWRPAQ